jgi:preprotein translocase subunit SecF
MQLFPVGKVYDFMRYRRVWAAVSVVMTLGTLVLLVYPGPSLGTDFRGGTELELAFKKHVDDEAIRQAVSEAGFSSPDVIRIADPAEPERFMIRVQEVSTIEEGAKRQIEKALCFGDGVDAAQCPEAKRPREVKFSPGGDKISLRYNETPDLSAVRTALAGGVGGVQLRAGDGNPMLQNAREHRVEIALTSKGDQLLAALTKVLGAEVVPDAPLRVEWVGPKAGAQLRDSALKSIAVALVFITVYIAFRFDLRFAPGAAIATVHDSLSTIGILILFGQEITLTTVAALLTIVGYSVNDTVVVFDRVRENLVKHRGMPFAKIINLSLSEMLGRTIIASGTPIVSMLGLFAWGTGSLKDFAFTLVIGLVLGTYSSIYIALPLTWWLDTKFLSRGEGVAKAPVARPKKAEAVV